MHKIKDVISRILNHNLLIVLVVFACLYTLGTQGDRYYGWTNPENTKSEQRYTIQSDGSGYYAYLPQLFIYEDQPNFIFLEGIWKKYNTAQFFEAIGVDFANKKGTDKYFIGTAVCISPFFLINHTINKIVYGKGDGYSKSYQFSVSVAALFYWLLGIIGLIKLLQKFKISNFTISIVVAFISLGTSLNFYTSHFPSFSHVYSFCIITWFLLICKLWVDTKKEKYIIWIGFLAGMIFIIRPTNSFVILLIPFFFSNWKEFKIRIIETLKIYKLHLILSALLFLTLGFLQLLNVHSQTGIWSFNTYSGEHFDFLFKPKWKEVLFSYEKGFFVYAPIMLLLIPAMIFGFKNRKYFMLGWTLVFFFLVYISSSWWCWWYGGGLGMRPFVDFTGFLILPIAFFFDRINKWLKIGIIIFGIGAIYLYQIFQIQYNRNILHYDQVTKEEFWEIFLKTDKRFSWMLHYEQQKILPNSIIHSKSHYLNPRTLNWGKTPFPQEIGFFKFETKDPTIIFHPEKSWGNSIIGIKLNGGLNLSNPESSPSIRVNAYKSGNLINKVELFFGYKIVKLNCYLPFEISYNEGFEYSKIDSLEVILTKGYPITKIKNINCTIYSLKKEKIR